MPRSKPGLPYEDHQLIGQDLYEIRNRLNTICTIMADAYPISKHKKLPKKAVASIDKLRHTLNALMVEEDHNCDPADRNRIYYCSSIKDPL